MIILGLNAYHPDAAVAVLKDGVPVWAAEEERFSRVKHASGFPALALQRCFKDLQIPFSAVDAVAISKNPHANIFRKILYVLKEKPKGGLVADRVSAFRKSAGFEKDFFATLDISPAYMRAKFFNIEHHQTHAASSFYFAGFEDAAFLSIDGLGDFSSAMWGEGQGNQIRVIDRVYFPHSAGFLYTAGTQFLGFLNFGDEYKVMGLAAYGKPTHLNEFRRMIRFLPGGKFELNLDYFTHHRGHAKIRWQGGAPEQEILYSEKWLEKFGYPRPSKDPLTERDKNIAASLQGVFEELLFHILNHLHKQTKNENLCLAGGAAYNSLANGKISRMTSFKNIYIQPAAGDSGSALGAAAFVYHSVYKRPPHTVMNHAYLGPSYTDLEIEKMLIERKLCFERLRAETLGERTARDIAEGMIVGWFQGKMEFGPRALGNRSILADPRRPDMKDILNKRVKNREGFRPFAPAVLEERAHEYFEMDCAESPFMLKVFSVKPEKRSVLPAITHEDGTARVQTVSKETNSIFWLLIREFEKQTGVPVILNTSFNENEPVVCSPEEALGCFLKTKMDVLVLGSYYLRKENDR